MENEQSNNDASDNATYKMEVQQSRSSSSILLESEVNGGVKLIRRTLSQPGEDDWCLENRKKRTISHKLINWKNEYYKIV